VAISLKTRTHYKVNKFMRWLAVSTVNPAGLEHVSSLYYNS